MGGINGLPKNVLSSIRSSQLKSFLGDNKLGVDDKLIGELENGDLKAFITEVSEIERQGEITRDKIDKLIFDCFSAEEIDSFNDSIKQVYGKVNNICLLVDKLFKDIFDNYKLKKYDILNYLLDEISEVSYLLLSNSLYTNPYFKDTYGLEQIDKIEIIVHRLTRIIYDLYNIGESIDIKSKSKKIEETADKLWGNFRSNRTIYKLIYVLCH